MDIMLDMRPWVSLECPFYGLRIQRATVGVRLPSLAPINGLAVFTPSLLARQAREIRYVGGVSSEDVLGQVPA